MRNNSSGFTLIEVMIGSALVATLTVGIIGVKVFVNRAASDTTTRRDAYRVAELAMNDAIKNDRFIIPQDLPPDPKTVKTWFFTDDTHSATRCLDSMGRDIPWPAAAATTPANAQNPATNIECPFMVSFFKLQEVDRVMATSEPLWTGGLTPARLPSAARLPVSRYRMKVRYRLRAPNAEKPLDPVKDFDVMEVTRMVTHVIPF